MKLGVKTKFVLDFLGPKKKVYLLRSSNVDRLLLFLIQNGFDISQMFSSLFITLVINAPIVILAKLGTFTDPLPYKYILYTGSVKKLWQYKIEVYQIGGVSMWRFYPI